MGRLNFSRRAIAATVGGTIGGLAGGGVGALADTAGESEAASAVANNVVAGNIGTPITAIIAAAWPKPSNGRKNGCK